MPERYTITLPLPHKHLSPNSRCHWARKAAKVKAQRLRARWCMAGKLDRHKPAPKWKAAKATCRFYFAVNRWRDADNLLAMMKSAFDGIEDSGLLANDKDLSHEPVVRLIDKANPRVEVTITKGGGDETD